LGEISAPTLVIVGGFDIDGMRNNAEQLATGIPGAELVVLPGVGHLPNMEDSALFNRAVLDFLDA
jgi:pimeloyl-ACP methyl ester carboxylesterase